MTERLWRKAFVENAKWTVSLNEQGELPPLHFAAQLAYLEAVTALLDARADAAALGPARTFAR